MPGAGLTLLLGGARSGKSRLAVELAAKTGRSVVFVATARAEDPEMEARIAAHRCERPDHWRTVEAPVALAAALAEAPEADTVVVDCLTLWVSNLMAAEVGDVEIRAAAEHAAEVASARSGATIAVSNEVGSGIVPIHPVARRYRDLLGLTNALWAERAAHAWLVVAGRVLRLERTDVLGAGLEPGPSDS